jgi:NADH-quinone oxidoreductase subunit F
MEKVYHRMLDEGAHTGDVDLLLDIAQQMDGNCFCLLGEFSVSPVRSSILHFREEYEALAKG